MQRFAFDWKIRNELTDSNSRLQSFSDTAAVIEQREETWSQGEGREARELAQSLTNNECADYLRTVFIEYYQMLHGYSLFEEAFLTNRYGALVCQTSESGHYYYGDKAWWQQAKKEGYSIEETPNVAAEKTAAIDIAVRIEDAEGNFLGVLKSSMPLLSLLRESEIIVKRYDTTNIQLITEDGHLLYESGAFSFMTNISDTPYFDRLKQKSDFFIIHEHERTKLLSYARSAGYGTYRGLDWFLILKHNVRDILKNILILRRVMIIASVAVFVMAITIAGIIIRTIRRPLDELHHAAEQVATGELGYRLDIRSNDEIGEFAQTFNNMTRQLQKSYRDLESEIAVRKEIEAQLERKNEDLERSNQELDDFSYIVSHDLREPLRGISNYSEILLEDYADKLDEEAVTYVNSLKRLSNRLDNLIQSLLYYSRAGRFDLSFEKTDLNQVLEETLESLDVFLRENNATIEVPRKLPEATCDRTRVGEIFANLITNAVKYNDKEEKNVVVGFDDTQNPVVFYVQDNGIGIREKHLDSVFKIFKRLHPRDRYGGGTGSGLTIVRKLVERHGGSIWVESTYGEGSTFYFTLEAETNEVAAESNNPGG
jgi:signal transduction histidine kinase